MDEDRDDFQDTYPVDFRPSQLPAPEGPSAGESELARPRLRLLGSRLAFLRELMTYRIG
jgi:hypothetical protein